MNTEKEVRTAETVRNQMRDLYLAQKMQMSTVELMELAYNNARDELKKENERLREALENSIAVMELVKYGLIPSNIITPISIAKKALNQK